jgi:CBS domain-containing protein
MIGVLSERDVVRALAERGASALTEPLARVMTRNVSTCSPSDSQAYAHGNARRIRGVARLHPNGLTIVSENRCSHYR